jgi:group I intron endonuclease
MSNQHIVYKATSKANGKIYIGYTSQGLEARWSKHWSDANAGRSYHFQRALKKYGRDGFTLETIYESENSVEALYMEQFYIRELNSFDPNIGYNKTMGGQSGKMTEETRRKNGLVHKGKVVSAETRAKLSTARKGQTHRIIEVECPHCHKVGSSKIMPRWHFDNCKENPNLSSDQKEELAKKRSDNIKNGSAVAHENLRNGTRKGSWLGKKQPVVSCPHCDVQGGIMNMNRYHFDNCKMMEAA